MTYSFTNDGKNTPRENQKEILEWLNTNLDKYDVVGISAYVGSGKSFIVKTIQNYFYQQFSDINFTAECAPKVSIITPNNVLSRQYKKDYPDTNICMGKSQYKCSEKYKTCLEFSENTGKASCSPTCPYQLSRQACSVVPTIYNLYSYIFSIKSRGVLNTAKIPYINLIDEADKCLLSLLAFAGHSFPLSYYNFKGDPNNKKDVLDYLKKYKKIISDKKEDDYVRENKRLRNLDKIDLIITSFEQNPNNYVAIKSSKYFKIMPFIPPDTILRLILGTSKTILLSATLLDSDLDLFRNLGLKVTMVDMKTIIPKNRRAIFAYTSPYKKKAKNVTPNEMASVLTSIFKILPKKPILIHTTYGRMEPLAAALSLDNPKLKIYTHTPENKFSVLKTWEGSNGVLLGAGLEAGVDLKDDKCRVNIIPRLRFASLDDPWVAARKSLKDGATWYLLDAVKTLIQAVGRGVRNQNDWCLTVITDPVVYFVLNSLKSKGVKLPKDFLNAFEPCATYDDLKKYVEEFNNNECKI